jgi:hypothetical protein
MMLFLACATGDISVSGITWQSWGTVAAYGQGTLNVNNCVPYCAAGTTTSYPASVEVSAPSAASGVPIFQQVTVTPMGGGQVESNTAPGWGWV